LYAAAPPVNNSSSSGTSKPASGTCSKNKKTRRESGMHRRRQVGQPPHSVIMIMCTIRIETTPSLPPPYTASTQPRLPSPNHVLFFPLHYFPSLTRSS
jgi:hypothetical protein